MNRPSAFRGDPRRLTRVLAASFLLTSACASATWSPPPPAGPTYVYEDQGFVEKKTAVGVGGTRNFGYGAAFSFRGSSGVHGDAVKDPFQQSVPIDGIQFNEHLAGQGLAVTPTAAAPTPVAKPAKGKKP